MSDEGLVLDKFGEFIVKTLRDETIEHFDILAQGNWKAPALQKLQNELKDFTEDQISVIKRCIINSIDAGIHSFLFSLQERADFNNDIQIIVDGNNVVEASDGIHGEAFGEDGWYARFSKYGESPEEW